jgi:hypothetical protein
VSVALHIISYYTIKFDIILIAYYIDANNNWWGSKDWVNAGEWVGSKESQLRVPWSFGLLAHARDKVNLGDVCFRVHVARVRVARRLVG